MHYIQQLSTHQQYTSMNTPSQAPAAKKIFNEDQANASLVFIGAIAQDIVRKWASVLSMEPEERGKHLAKLSDTRGPKTMVDAELLIEEIHYHTREITSFGCYVKNLGDGTILFPTEIDGEPSYLTWKVGDTVVRKPSPALV